MTNLHYVFHKQYYESLSYKNYQTCNERLVTQRFAVGPPDAVSPCANVKFALKTRYPGLLIGLGNIHEANSKLTAGSEKDGTEIKLGFSLDYVTGQPLIPGSTVKGVLRSAFKYHPEYVMEILNSNTFGFGYDAKGISDLMNIIFGSQNGIGSCIFFDAIPTRTGQNGRLLGLDNITPHKANDPKDNWLTEPIPLTMLKVIPDVVFLFRFKYKEEQGGLTASQLCKLFSAILTDLGIGAKTNIGFGIMELCRENDCSMNNTLTAGEQPVIADIQQRGNPQQQSQPQGFSNRLPETGSLQPNQAPAGICRKCGDKTGFNAKTGKHHEFCFKCSQPGRKG